eukprot:m.49539 g.49539  ORF g.49539 m.49539 type:complete len:266 (+) comp21044_c0_seq2:322-1119(+)
MALFTLQSNPSSRHRIPVVVPQIRPNRPPLALPEPSAQRRVPTSSSNTNTAWVTINSEITFEAELRDFESPSFHVVSHKNNRNYIRTRKESIVSRSSGYSGFDHNSSSESSSSLIVDIDRLDSDSSFERSISGDSFEDDSCITVRNPVASFDAASPIIETPECLECYICYVDVEDSEKHCLDIALNKSCGCRYPIHADCLNTWLAAHHKCIICRAPMSISTRKMRFESATPGSERRLPRLKRRYQSKNGRNRTTPTNNNVGCVIA